MFEYDESEKRFIALHHPFTSPKNEDLERLESEPEKVRSEAYDFVLNGWEVGGGSIRIHRRDLQKRVFALLGIGEKEAEERFGFLLEALSYGARPMAASLLAWTLGSDDNRRRLHSRRHRFPKNPARHLSFDRGAKHGRRHATG